MGKNTQGGSSHKKYARKFTSVSNAKTNRLKLSENEDEVYAIATKMLGSCMFHCHCIDGVKRLVHIRGKFSGRSKRDNFVEVGKWVLVGLREWNDVKSSTDKNKMQQCDLLNVYSDLDKPRLKDAVNANWSELENNDVTREVQGVENGIIDDDLFGTDQDFERDRLISHMRENNVERITMAIGEENDAEVDDEINVDDI